MYNINNIVIVDKNGLFICIDPGYPGSFHDVTCLSESNLDPNWRQFFAHINEYVEMVLGDVSYIGTNHSLLHRMRKGEIPPCIDCRHHHIDVFNKMHIGYRIRVEWGIGG